MRSLCSKSAMAILGLVVVVLVSSVGVAGASGPEASPQQAPTCEWEKLPGQFSQGHFHMAAAMDSVNHAWYFYGGLDRSNDLSNFVGKLDLSKPDIGNAEHGVENPSGGRLERYGAVGAFRPAGDESNIYFIGGGESDGSGEDDIQVHNAKANTWGTISPSGAFRGRLFHSGAYDPEHDVIVVAGGTDVCRADGSDVGEECRAANLGTSFLVFSPTGGGASWENGPSGGPGRFFGHSMVYDSAAKRMLVYGGSRDGSRAENAVYELDLADPDLSKAEWARLTTSGTPPPARFMHAAAYDPNSNRMYIYGGVTRGAFTSREDADASTFFLDLNQEPPAWEVLQDATAGDRVGAVLGYSRNHSALVLHGGRGQFRSTGQNVSRESHWLDCTGGQPPTPTSSPTYTASPTQPTATQGPPTETPTPTERATRTTTPTETPTLGISATPTSTSTSTPTEEPDRYYAYIPFTEKG